MSEQKPMIDPVVAALHRELYTLRRDLERAERAAGRVAADKQKCWSDVAEALGVEAGLPDAPKRCLEAVRGLQAAMARQAATIGELQARKIWVSTPADEDPLTP